MKVLVVYDDTAAYSEVIRDVIGKKRLGDVVVRKKKVQEHYFAALRRLFPTASFCCVKSKFEFQENYAEWSNLEDVRVLHCFSRFVFLDADAALLSFEKLNYVNAPYRALCGKQTAALFFPDVRSYLELLKSYQRRGEDGPSLEALVPNAFPISGLLDIGVVSNFIQYITGAFDSRFFNRLDGNEYTLTKSSTNREKIKKEYTFYQLLPEDMKPWFVMPYQYQETAERASYTMERLHVTDLAIQWVHGSFSLPEFEELMDKYFYFFQNVRHSKTVSREVYQKTADALYVDKVKARLQQMKDAPAGQKVLRLLEAADVSLDALAGQYFALKAQLEAEVKRPAVSVIGHGDPCFSNVLYNKNTKMMKFIDPKGALTEAELWTDPYYDLAKLSHSVCGWYDFFNNGLVDVRLSEDLSYTLELDFDNSPFVAVFRRKLEEAGFDFRLVRLYEASLFLSMLPLHLDYPYKVLGFILNAQRILKEVEGYV